MVNGMAFSPDGASLAVSDSNFAGIRVWDIYSNKILYTLTDAQDLSHRFLSFSYDGSLLVSGTFSGSLYFWDCSSGSLEKSLTGHASDVMDIKFSPDGVLLASISEDNQIIIWGIP
jgi:WD40 repeat protein